MAMVDVSEFLSWCVHTEAYDVCTVKSHPSLVVSEELFFCSLVVHVDAHDTVARTRDTRKIIDLVYVTSE